MTPRYGYTVCCGVLNSNTVPIPAVPVLEALQVNPYPCTSLGTITPRELCRHINQVIIPALDLSEKKSSICKCTAINWLKKLGYMCRDVKKGVYHDGHECPDVIKAHKKFLDQMQQYER